MTEQTLQSAYDRRTLLADFARSAAGLFFTLGPALFLNPIPVLFWIFLAAGMLFLAFGAKTLQKWFTTVEMTADSLTIRAPFTATLTWKDLSTAKLRFYATRRKTRKGWMQLSLKDGRVRIVVDSALTDFDTVAKYAAHWIKTNDVELDIPSRENFLALGIRMDGNSERGTEK